MTTSLGQDRTEQLRQLEPLVQGRPDAMVALARQFAAVGEQRSAIDLATRARALAGGDGEVRTLAAELLCETVPTWHFVLVRDEIRNQAYEDAIRRAVTPGCTVLEIGTGTGILAMMAARAGARVVTCESDPAMAAVARDVIAANGLADRIQVVNRHSSELDVLAELGGRADLLVSEIVSNDLLSEGVLPAHADAVTRLLKPGAAVIPARGRVRVALGYDRRWSDTRIEEVSGFDLSHLNRVARPNREIRIGSPRLSLRSEAADLFDFDFASSGPVRDGRERLELASAGGIVNGIAQWIALDLDSSATYENDPDNGVPSCWAALFWPFAEPIDTRAGEIVTVAGYHTDDRIRIWREVDL